MVLGGARGGGHGAQTALNNESVLWHAAPQAPPLRKQLSNHQSFPRLIHSSRVLMLLSFTAADHQLSMLQHSDRTGKKDIIITTTTCCYIQRWSSCVADCRCPQEEALSAHSSSVSTLPQTKRAARMENKTSTLDVSKTTFISSAATALYYIPKAEYPVELFCNKSSHHERLNDFKLS